MYVELIYILDGKLIAGVPIQLRIFEEKSIILDHQLVSTETPLKFEFIASTTFTHNILAIIKDFKGRMHAVCLLYTSLFSYSRLEHRLMYLMHQTPLLHRQQPLPHKFNK